MNRSRLIKVIDFCSFMSLLVLISSGTVLKYTLPPRSGGKNIWGLTRHEWGDIHFYISVAFLILMSMHLWTHIRFIKQAIIGKAIPEHNYRLAIGLVSILLLIALIFSPVFSPVNTK